MTLNTSIWPRARPTVSAPPSFVTGNMWMGGGGVDRRRTDGRDGPREQTLWRPTQPSFCQMSPSSHVFRQHREAKAWCPGHLPPPQTGTRQPVPMGKATVTAAGGPRPLRDTTRYRESEKRRGKRANVPKTGRLHFKGLLFLFSKIVKYS